MPEVLTRQLNDPYELGAVYLEVDQAYQGADYSDVFAAFIPVLESFHTNVFTSQASPGGEPWAPNAPATVEKKGHGVILFETGEEEASLEGTTGGSIRDVEDRFFVFGTSVDHAIFHNDPGPRPGSREPRRQDVGMNDELVDNLTNRVAEALVEKLKG
jgi:hypothetical protein